ncbi:MAG: glycerol-3-phosphate 1-O-acyltransferase PlsY [Clostridiales bacterium]|nr:glycerol-3-phosphate 1-O-acyltransferase PlsY [Clostridiales bacterium]
MLNMRTALAGILAYLLGSLTFGMLVPRMMGTSRDIRKEGSGNVGATNVLRTQGKLQGGLVLAGDMLKGSLAAGLGLWLAGNQGGGIAGLCAVLGHCFPLYFGFRGGKAVATAAGVLFVLFPASMWILLPVFLLATALSRMVSLGSLGGAAALILCPFLFHASLPVTVFCICSSLLVIWKHQGNIQRILAGTESKLGHKKDGGHDGG